MTDQPPEAEFGGSNGGYDDSSYLEGSGRSETLLSGPSRDASAAFFLGIMGLATCGLLSPLALYYGHRALSAAELVGGALSPTGRSARLGQVMGLIGTTFMVIQITLILVFGMRAWDFVTDLRWPDLGWSRSE